jgi:hypothetical protein
MRAGEVSNEGDDGRVIQRAPMRRRGLSVTILIVFAVQLLAPFAFASVCLEPCPEDAPGSSCPLVCVHCSSCTHAQTAIVRNEATGTLLVSTHRFVAHAITSIASLPAADIFHVPLLG